MKTYIILIVASFLVSCASTPPVTVQDTLPFITPAAQLATGAVLQFSSSDNTTRQQLANQLYGVAKAVRTLTGGEVPTVDVLKSTILSFTDKYPQWIDLSASLGSIYAGFYPKIQGDTKLAFEVLEAIAEGVESGAAQMAPAAKPTP